VPIKDVKKLEQGGKHEKEAEWRNVTAEGRPTGKVGQPSKKKHVLLDAWDRMGETKSKKPGIKMPNGKQAIQVEEKVGTTETRDDNKSKLGKKKAVTHEEIVVRIKNQDSSNARR